MARRTGQLTLNALTALSLLLCVSTAGLWARSYTNRPWSAIDTHSVRIQILRGELCLDDSPAGALAFKRWLAFHDRRRELLLQWYKLRAEVDADLGGAAAVAERQRVGRDLATLIEQMHATAMPRARGCLQMPWEDDPEQKISQPWEFRSKTAVPMLAIGLAALPLMRTVAALSRRARSRQGFCRHCSYDLTANVSGICPECGTPTEAT